MYIIIFSLYCLCKLAAYVVIAQPGGVKVGEKICVFRILIFEAARN